MTTVTEQATIFGLHRLTVADVEQTVTRCLGAHSAAVVWPKLAAQAQLGDRSDDEAVHRLVIALAAAPDPVLRLCARAVGIRLTTYTELSRLAETLPA